MNALRIYLVDGSPCHTRRVAAADIDTHIAARDALAKEAQLLREFASSDGIPTTLCGELLQESEGTDEYGDFVRYVAVNQQT